MKRFKIFKMIPYEKMWEDDRHWLPPVLSGKKIMGYFIFNDEKMLSHRVDTYGEAQAWRESPEERE